jgi:hypothetical protein
MIMVSYEAGAATPKPVEKKGGGCGVVIVLVLLLLVVGGGAAAFFFLHHKKGGGSKGWDGVTVGSSYEGVSETHMDGAADMKVTMKKTLLSITAEKAHVKLETGDQVSEMDEDLKPKLDDKAPKPVEEKDESLEVNGVKFDCHYTKFVIDGNTTETWVADGVPIPVKTVTSGDKFKSTWTLTKIDKK